MKAPIHNRPFRRKPYNRRLRRYDDFSSGLPSMNRIDFDDTMELGLFGIDDLLGVIGDVTGVTKAGKGLLQEIGILDKPKKSTTTTQPQLDLSQLAGLMGQAGQGQAGGGYTGPSAQEIQYIIKDMLSSISPPIRQKVREVINEMKGSDASEENLVANIEQRVGSNVMPMLNKAIEALKLAQTQTEATSEHRSIVRNEDRWRENMSNQQQLMNRIALMEKRIAKALNNKKR